MKTVNQCEIQNPVTHYVKEKPTLRMINKYNIAELSLVEYVFHDFIVSVVRSGARLRDLAPL